MGIISIQSHVTYGHVGNSAAVFPLQRAGFEVWPIHTVAFSNHTAYADWPGPIFDPQVVADVFAGLERRGAAARTQCVLTGYLGAAPLAHTVVDIVRQVKQANPQALFAFDPVMGNAVFGQFVDPALPALFRDEVVPLADVITPNQYEVALLAGQNYEDLAASLPATIATTRGLLREGGRALVTSVSYPELGADEVAMLALDSTQAWLIRTPKLPSPTPTREFGGKLVGTGDLTAAMFTANVLRGVGLAQALENTAGVVFGTIERTVRADSAELELISSQELFGLPPHTFKAVQLEG